VPEAVSTEADSLRVHDVYSIANKHPIIDSARFSMMFRNAPRLLLGHARHPASQLIYMHLERRKHVLAHACFERKADESA